MKHQDPIDPITGKYSFLVDPAESIIYELNRGMFDKVKRFVSGNTSLDEREIITNKRLYYYKKNSGPGNSRNFGVDYANGDSLFFIADGLKLHHKEVTEVAYQEDLTDRVNTNLQRVSVLLLSLVVLLVIICYSLISNSVRLSVYSRRFAIHTMKLVGASWGFVRKPFLRQALTIGLIAALLACGVLGGVVYALYTYQPGAEEVVGPIELGITAASVFFFGLFITLVCTFFSVNKFLRMTAGELYKI